MYDEAYDESMERVRGQLKNFRNLAMDTLQWISYAQRPLSPEELLVALATGVGEISLKETNYTTMEKILSVCAGLVTVDKSRNVMRLIHHTTQEYFDRKKSKWFPRAESHMMNVCTTYLAFDRFEAGPPQRDWSPSAGASRSLPEYPFYDYAANNWGHHARASPVPTDELELPKFLASANKFQAAVYTLFERSSDFSVWLQRPGLPQRASWPQYIILQKHDSQSSLHLLAAFGIAKLIKKMSFGPQKIFLGLNDRVGYTPLSYAVAFGHRDVVKLLLDERSDLLEVRNRFGETPLHIAAQYGREEILQFLMDKGADIDAQDNLHWTPLYCAAHIRHKRIMEMLLDRGAKTEIEVKTNIGTKADVWVEIIPMGLKTCDAELSPLHSFFDQEERPNDYELIELLLQRGAKADARDESGTTLLLNYASLSDDCIDLDKWELILRHGAKVDARDNLGWTALSFVAFRGLTRFAKRAKEGPIEFLLRNGANVNGDQLDEKSREMFSPEFTPLMLTVHQTMRLHKTMRNQTMRFRDNKDDARALLNGGADVNRTSRKGLTALQMAAKNGAKGVLQVLLSSSLIDVNFKFRGRGNSWFIAKPDLYNETALSLAVQQPRNEAVIKLLLRDGRADASLSVKNVRGQTPIDQARSLGYKSYERLLGKAMQRRDEYQYLHGIQWPSMTHIQVVPGASSQTFSRP